MSTAIPPTLEDYDIHDALVSRLILAAKRPIPPHLLLEGPPGTGKTTLARLYAKAVVGSVGEANFLELNASDQRGIDVVRTKVLDFASLRGLAVDRKVILLDEADFMTREAQATLRQIMVECREHCTFVLTGNILERIQLALRSRCMVCHVPRLSPAASRRLAAKICENSRIAASPSFIGALAEASSGDIRYIENNLTTAIDALAAPEKLLTDFLEEVRLKGPKAIVLSPILERVPFASYAAVLKRDLDQSDLVLEVYLELIELLAQVDRRLIDGGDRGLQITWCIGKYGARRGWFDRPVSV